MIGRCKIPSAMVLLVLSTHLSAEPTQPSAPLMSLYHSTNVDQDIVRGDLLYCFEVAGLALSNYSSVAARHEYGLVGSLMGGLLGSGGTKRMRSSIVDRCMLAHGYRIIRVPAPDWQKTLDLDRKAKLNPSKADPAIVDALAEFAAGPLPAGMGGRQ